jgi:hypothetical protein
MGSGGHRRCGPTADAFAVARYERLHSLIEAAYRC